MRLGPLSFYQVNTLAAEQLYSVAAQYAQLTSDDALLDLYCGMGTIGLSMADQCRELIGVEIVPEAIESAKANAARMGEAVAAKSRFFCADAGQAATQLAAEGLHPDMVLTAQNDIGVFGVDVEQDGTDGRELPPQCGAKLLCMGQLCPGAYQTHNDLPAVRTAPQEDVPYQPLAALLIEGRMPCCEKKAHSALPISFSTPGCSLQSGQGTMRWVRPA